MEITSPFAMQVVADFLEREIKGFADLFHRHAEIGVAALWVWSALCQAVPAPGKGASWSHVTFYNISHLISGNLRLLGKRSGSDGYLDQRFGTGNFTREELAKMIETKQKEMEKRAGQP